MGPNDRDKKLKSQKGQAWLDIVTNCQMLPGQIIELQTMWKGKIRIQYSLRNSFSRQVLKYMILRLHHLIKKLLNITHYRVRRADRIGWWILLLILGHHLPLLKLRASWPMLVVCQLILDLCHLNMLERIVFCWAKCHLISILMTQILNKQQVYKITDRLVLSLTAMKSDHLHLQ